MLARRVQEAEAAYTGERYRAAIESYVDRLNAHGIYVVLRLSGSGPGEHVYGAAKGVSEMPMADADHSLDFWRSVATRFRDNHAVLFHAYDEPHKISWRAPATAAHERERLRGRAALRRFRRSGHQAIVDAIRSTGATQPIIVSGIDFAGDLTAGRSSCPTTR